MELLNVLAASSSTCQIANVTVESDIVSIFAFLGSLIKFGVPVLLIIWGSWDLGKAVMAQKEDEIKNAQKLFIKKLIIALCVFLVPTFIGIALDVIDGTGNTSEAKNCLSEIF